MKNYIKKIYLFLVAIILVLGGMLLYFQYAGWPVAEDVILAEENEGLSAILNQVQMEAGENEGFEEIFERVKTVVVASREPAVLPVLPDTEHQVPIIMYHYVRVVDKEKDALGYNLSINPSDFEKQMKYLKDEGYTTIHMKDLLDKKVPKKAIVLVFDDGLEDFYTAALPVLQKYGFTASNAVITGMIGAHEHMTEVQIRECVVAGIELLSHTVSHLDMSKLSKEQLKKELAESKDYLEKTFGVEVKGFVYPSGRYNNLAVQMVKDEGYEIATTTQYGEANLKNNNILLLPRVRIDNRDGYNGFVKKLEAIGK